MDPFDQKYSALKVAIFDIDGTIADDRRRRKYLPEPRDGGDGCYAKYHEDCGNDPVINRNLVEKHVREGHFIAFVTARPKTVMVQTSQWIEKHFGQLPNFALIMRDEGDKRPSAVFKRQAVGSRFFWQDIVAAYDDREDVLEAYREAGVHDNKLILVRLPETPGVPDIMRSMASTFEARNAVYGSNYRMVGPIMKILFPNGVPPHVLHSDQFHLFELKIVKLSRFAISNLTHIDSIHDDAVYSAMIESILLEKESAQ